MCSRVALRAGITRVAVRSHVIRHSVASAAVESGVDLPTTAGMLGHSGTGTISTYLHTRASRVEAARETVRSIMQVINPRTGARGR